MRLRSNKSSVSQGSAAPAPRLLPPGAVRTQVADQRAGSFLIPHPNPGSWSGCGAAGHPDVRAAQPHPVCSRRGESGELAQQGPGGRAAPDSPSTPAWIEGAQPGTQSAELAWGGRRKGPSLREAAGVAKQKETSAGMSEMAVQVQLATCVAHCLTFLSFSLTCTKVRTTAWPPRA